MEGADLDESGGTLHLNATLLRLINKPLFFCILLLAMNQDLMRLGFENLCSLVSFAL